MPSTPDPTTLVHAARPGPRPMTPEDLLAIPRVGGPVPSPDGRLLAVPVVTPDLESNELRGRIWLVPAEAGAGEPRPLTPAGDSCAEPAFSPDSSRLAFVRKPPAARDARGMGPSARPQLCVMPLDGGGPECLTALPLGVFDPRWLPDGTGIVFAAKVLKGFVTPEATAAELARRERDPVQAHVTEERFYRHWDTWLTTGEVPHLFLLDLATRSLLDLTPDSEAWFDWLEPAGQYDLSPDGREVAFAGRTLGPATGMPRAAIWTAPVPAATGAGRPRGPAGPLSCLTPDHPADDLLPRYTPDGARLVYGMQHDPRFYADRVRLMGYDRAAGTHAELVPGWALSPARWSFAPDGVLLVEAECDARVDLFALGPGDAEPRRLVRGGAVSGARGSRGRVHFTLQSLVQPPEVHGCAADGGGLTRLTRFTDGACARFALGEVREARFAGGGGEEVQMFVVLPPGWSAGERRPLVQVLHGGPHGIGADSFHWRWNAALFAAPDRIVGLVNFQGSTSWGQDFARRIQGAWPERPFADVMRATDLLVEEGWADGARLAAAGGSYGGYLVSWIEGHTDRFRCLVNHAGIYDTLAQYASDWTLGRGEAFGGEPWDGLERISAVNPAHAAAAFRTPMLVLHGEQDFRVPVAQGLECYGVLRAKGVTARLVHFPDEGHWVLKPRNALLWYREVRAWLGRFLGAAPDG